MTILRKRETVCSKRKSLECFLKFLLDISVCLKIKRAHSFFLGLALDGVGVDHSGAHIAVAK